MHLFLFIRYKSILAEAGYTSIKLIAHAENSTILILHHYGRVLLPRALKVYTIVHFVHTVFIKSTNLHKICLREHLFSSKQKEQEKKEKKIECLHDSLLGVQRLPK